MKRIKVVAFSGSTEGITALLGGHIDLVASPASGVLQLVQAGKARILAVASEKRLTGTLAGIPTCKELGLAVIAANWRSIVGPGGLSAEQMRYWDDAFARVSRLAEWKRGLETKLEEETYLNAADTRKYMEAQNTRSSRTALRAWTDQTIIGNGSALVRQLIAEVCNVAGFYIFLNVSRRIE